MKATAFVVGPLVGPGAAIMDLARRLSFGSVVPYGGLAQAEQQANITPVCYFLFATVPDVDALRGVALEGRATIVDDPDALWAVGVNVWERYNGPYSEDVRPMVEFMLTKRVAVRLDVERTRSWDHRKLGLPAMPLGGTTAR